MTRAKLAVKQVTNEVTLRACHQSMTGGGHEHFDMEIAAGAGAQGAER